MQTKTLIALLYDSTNAIDLNFGVGTSYHLHQFLKNDEPFTDPPFLYYFINNIKTLSSDIPSVDIVTQELRFAYLHKVEKQDNSDDLLEAIYAGEEVLTKLKEEVNKNDLISIEGYSEEPLIKFFDAYIGVTFTFSITSPDDFNYCTTDQNGLDYVLDFLVN